MMARGITASTLTHDSLAEYPVVSRGGSGAGSIHKEAVSTPVRLMLLVMPMLLFSWLGLQAIDGMARDAGRQAWAYFSTGSPSF